MPAFRTTRPHFSISFFRNAPNAGGDSKNGREPSPASNALKSGAPSMRVSSRFSRVTIARGVAPILVATGEHMANRIMFKQFLQADALQILQIDATRVAGVNENIAILLLAAKFGVPVCPHAGGVGLCEAVQHLSMFDFVAVSGANDSRVIEFVDHLHEHFVTPVEVHGGRYWPPSSPGAGTEMLAASIVDYSYPTHD